jgi:hypothetical protein
MGTIVGLAHPTAAATTENIKMYLMVLITFIPLDA